MSEVRRIGVVIPVYKSQRWLELTVDSVLRQKCQVPLELNIVDDGSPDDSAAVAERLAARDSRVSLLRQANAGTAAARNNGCRALSPEVDAVMFLDADDELEPNALQLLAEALGARADATAVYGLPRFVDTSGKLINYGEAERQSLERWRPLQGRLVPCDPNEPTSFDMLAVANWLTSPGQLLMRRAAFERTGGFDVQLKGPDDWDMWLKLSLHAPLTFLHQPVLRYRVHDAQVSKDVPAMNRNVQRMVDSLTSTLSAADVERLKTGFRLAHGRSARQRWEWSGRSLLRGDLLGSIKHARHALLDYWHLRRA